MRTLSRFGSLLSAAAVTLACLLLSLLPAGPAHADAPPVLANGFGLTQVGDPVGTPTNFTITVRTAQVAGDHKIHILLPNDYATATSKRYPVFYFLHGSGGNTDEAGSYPALVSQKMITVLPDGGLRGWYTDWLKQNTAAGAQNWETFHINQVIPFIDANLRTVATKQGRAIGGISMGGFGALHYAERHPGLFSQVASLSGDNDLSVASMDLRLAVVASLTNGLGAFCDVSACSFGPTVDSDAIFGTPYPVLNADWRWNEADPGQHVAALSGMAVSVYVGNNAGGVNGLLEWWLEGASERLKDHLDDAGIPVHYVNYGNGSTWGTGCDGGHNGGCWAQDLVDLVPRLEQNFAA